MSILNQYLTVESPDERIKIATVISRRPFRHFKHHPFFATIYVTGLGIHWHTHKPLVVVAVMDEHDRTTYPDDTPDTLAAIGRMIERHGARPCFQLAV